MEYLDKLQNRPLASIIAAQSKQEEPNAADVAKLTLYEDRKNYLREQRTSLLDGSTEALVALIDSYTEEDITSNQKLTKATA